MTLLAARRDASWFRRPNVHGPKKYHVVVKGGRNGLGEAGCNTWLDTDHSSVQAIDVHPAQRCNKPGCHRLWPLQYRRENGEIMDLTQPT